ncbi:MAG TPA: hypothetical protein VJ249_07040 [Candidatus Bathyarchaeia archaeon]|nr:hypothetical protein [Candidatus Bathyarchaeia archaeon]
MSQPPQVQLSEVKEWLNKETASQIEPLKSKAASMLKEVKERVEDTMDSAQKISGNSQNEMDRSNPKTYRFARNANKFSESLIGTLKTVKFSGNVQHESLRTLCDELEKTCANIDQLRRSAYPYISPYFIFDRRRLDVFVKRLFDMTKELRSFLTSKYGNVKTIDEVHSNVDKLIQTLNDMRHNEDNLGQTEARMRNLEREISEAKEKLLQISSNAELDELVKLDRIIEELRTEVKHNLRYLQKPFYKLQSLSRASEVAVPPDEIRKLDDYLADPLLTLVNEDGGTPTLRSILMKLETTITQGKLKLKSTRLRKAQDQIKAVLNDSLTQLQKQGQEALDQRKQILSSDAAKALQNESARLQTQLESMQKDYELVTSQSKALKNNQIKLKERTEYLKRELERRVSQLTRKNVQISFPT